MNIFRKWFVELRYYYYKATLPFPKILSNEVTLELLIDSKKSIARFGDGEFHMISQSEDLGFQEKNLQLANRLKEVLTSDNDACLIALPIGLHSMIGFNKVGDYFWKQFVVFHYRKYLSYFDFKKTYCSANVTRPYIDFANHNNSKFFFERMKELWLDKNVLIVEGEFSKLGVGNDLFEKAKSINRIITLPKGAFSLYDELLNACKLVINNYDLVLVSLGPTATVLAYDLSGLGVPVIDIGHIDLEYEWFLRGTKEKIAISGKHVNELSYDIQEEHIENPIYDQEIILRIN